MLNIGRVTTEMQDQNRKSGMALTMSAYDIISPIFMIKKVQSEKKHTNGSSKSVLSIKKRIILLFTFLQSI